MDAQPMVPRRKLGVIAAARAACLGEDEDALLVIHESAGLGEIGRTRTGFDHEAVAPAVGAGLADDAARSAGHLGDNVGAEALDDLVKRAGNRGLRRQRFDQAIPASDGLATPDRLAIAIYRPGRQFALAVGGLLVMRTLEGGGEMSEGILA